MEEKEDDEDESEKEVKEQKEKEEDEDEKAEETWKTKIKGELGAGTERRGGRKMKNKEIEEEKLEIKGNWNDLRKTRSSGRNKKSEGRSGKNKNKKRREN